MSLDLVLILTAVLLAGGFGYIIWSYAKGLRGSPKELWLLYVAKIVEYAAYGSSNLAFVLFLSADCGLSDIQAGSYIGVWSTLLTVGTILVGAVCDAIGIRRTLIIGSLLLLFARFFMPLTDNLYAVTLLGFVPVALGTAILGPVLSVGIKRFTTAEGATLGFGLFYTLMNVGWALGGWIFDLVRRGLGEHAMVTVPGLGVAMSTYQVIFAVGFFLTIPTLLLVLSMRDGVERRDDGAITIAPPPPKATGSATQAMREVVRKAARDTGVIFRKAVTERAFWIYIFLLGILVPVRIVFYHFHYTFPKYGIRVLGEGVKIGNIYSVLNPVLIVFLVPLIAAFTKKVSSYRMLMLGTFISASAVFLATLPAEIYTPLMDTWVGELVFDKWLDVPAAGRSPVFFLLITFIALFTIGEAIWSPRLLQFTAEIAPAGREGSYIALSYLPFFAAKLVAGPLSGWLLATYTPEGQASYPNHHLVWVWVGGMAMASPLGLVLFRKLFHMAERKELYGKGEAKDAGAAA